MQQLKGKNTDQVECVSFSFSIFFCRSKHGFGWLLEAISIALPSQRVIDAIFKHVAKPELLTSYFKAPIHDHSQDWDVDQVKSTTVIKGLMMEFSALQLWILALISWVQFPPLHLRPVVVLPVKVNVFFFDKTFEISYFYFSFPNLSLLFAVKSHHSLGCHHKNLGFSESAVQNSS